MPSLLSMVKANAQAACILNESLRPVRIRFRFRPEYFYCFDNFMSCSMSFF